MPENNTSFVDHRTGVDDFDLSPLSELVVLLGGRAVESGLSIEDLWAALADHWVKDDYADAAGFLDAGFKSRQIICGRSIKTFGA